jgi:hypothetical protein
MNRSTASSRVLFWFGIALAASFSLATMTQAATPYHLAWGRQFGTSNLDIGSSVALDGSGNAYVTGYSYGSLGGPNAGGPDVIGLKYDSGGDLLLSSQFGTFAEDYGSQIDLDAAGNWYISGETHAGLGGPHAGGKDAFVTKRDSTGAQVWARQLGTTSSDFSSSTAADGLGNVYISGQTNGNLAGTNAGSIDAFLAKYDTLGTLLWSRQIGTSGQDYSNAGTVDAAGNAYITGSTQGNLAGVSAGSTDAFLFKYDPAGNVLWSRQIGTSSGEQSESIAVDASGNAYISGYTGGDLSGQTNSGGNDAFLVKYDAAGNHLWTRLLGTANNEFEMSVAVDDGGNPYIVGVTQGSLAGPSAGGLDAFLAKYDSAGNSLWSLQFGTSADEIAYSVGVNSSGAAYVTGSTFGSLYGPLGGAYDGFLAKFVPEPQSLLLTLLGALGVLVRPRRFGYFDATSG